MRDVILIAALLSHPPVGSTGCEPGVAACFELYASGRLGNDNKGYELLIGKGGKLCGPAQLTDTDGREVLYVPEGQCVPAAGGEP